MFHFVSLSPSRHISSPFSALNFRLTWLIFLLFFIKHASGILMFSFLLKFIITFVKYTPLNKWYCSFITFCSNVLTLRSCCRKFPYVWYLWYYGFYYRPCILQLWISFDFLKIVVVLILSCYSNRYNFFVIFFEYVIVYLYILQLLFAISLHPCLNFLLYLYLDEPSKLCFLIPKMLLENIPLVDGMAILSASTKYWWPIKKYYTKFC